ncbi:MAG: hypothetical protein QF596_04455 [Acidimicrobiales bacterium]|jgi:anti-sigma regulatory factor (Ser/Thr protein kinase)|nr:hypothetical protein [Acidimicrobiales bacterium]HJM29205.1 hypothetical protein [Acidimicrobiales bacterium]HJM96750.1 hypothetical protein [Acidimicrobiales bacterium]
MENSDQVQLILPTSPSYEKVAQTTIAHLGIRSGFSLKEIEDLRSVMKETTNLFISARQWETPLHLNYQFSQRRMQVTVASQTTEPLEIKEELFETFQSIVLPLVTEVVVNREKAWVVFEIAAESEDVS